MTVSYCLSLAAVLSLTGLAAAWRMPRVWLMSLFGTCGAAMIAAAAIWVDPAPWDWRSTVRVGGEPLHLRLDGLGAFFLALLAVLCAVAGFYGRTYWAEREHPRSARAFRVWWVVLLVSQSLVLLSANGLHFLIAWEVFAVAAYFLITLDRRQVEVRAAGWLYLAVSHAGTLCLFGFFSALAAHSGSWELGPHLDQPGLGKFFWLALVGFGIKAGLFPLHVWLPSAHANAPSPVSAILSGLALKMGVFGLVRFSGWLPVPEAAAWVVLAMGGASAILGVAFALGQHDLKRLLAYHSVENVGIIILGLGMALIGRRSGSPMWARLALAGGLLHVWNHGLFKSLLFLGAGGILHATGTRRMSEMGGLWRGMPWTTTLFTVGAVAIAGLPPLNGFVSEWLLFLGLFQGALKRGTAAVAAIPAALLLGMTGALALACFVKVCGVVFLGAPRSPRASRAHESSPAMLGAMGVLAGGCVAIGLAAPLLWRPLSVALATWEPAWTGGSPPPSLSTLTVCHGVLVLLGSVAVWGLWRVCRRRGIQRAPTWDCGYSRPTPRMQYTAGSFAAILTSWFRWVLRPEREGPSLTGLHPGVAHLHEHTPETVLERVVQPVAARVLALSTWVRQFQHGRLQSYILYLVLGLLALALLAWGGTP